MKHYPARLSHNIWETPELSSINRLPMYASSVPCNNLEEARLASKSPSAWQIYLDGTWSFQLFKCPEDCPAGELISASSETGNEWREIPVPSNWTMLDLDYPHADKPIYTNIQMPWDDIAPLVPKANPTGLYKTSFSLPSTWKKRRTIIHFAGVETYFELYVNGSFLGMAKDSRLPSEFELSSVLQAGENTIAVKVLRWSDANYIEDQDHWLMAGIFRSVYLYSSSIDYIADFFVRPDWDPETGTASIEVETQIAASILAERSSGPEANWNIEAQVYTDAGQLIWSQAEQLSTSWRLSHYKSKLGGAINAYQEKLTHSLASIKPWSPEVPQLYTFVLIFKEISSNKKEKIHDIRRCRIGFKRIAIANRELRINGKLVYIKGVNRNEFDTRHGKMIPKETMIKDIKLLKQFNFNAVRTSHYPNDVFWYELCDEHGILLIDEANIEAHANYSTIVRDSRWASAFQERVLRMIERDKNHVSIMAWSVGNETGHAANFADLTRLIKERDPARYLHNEGEVKAYWSQEANSFTPAPYTDDNDTINAMYIPVDVLRQWSLSSLDQRPFILSEYAHAMGNSSGGLKEYWDTFFAYHGLQGGFIWDWVDQAFIAQDHDGEQYFLYGGDYGELKHDSNFCCNGMISADRQPRPAIFEFKKLAQPIAVEVLSIGEGRFCIVNKQNFLDMSNLVLHIKIELNGVIVYQHSLEELFIAPETKQNIKLELPQLDLTGLNSEAFIYFSFVLREASFWAKKGHELAWEQFAYPLWAPAKSKLKSKLSKDSQILETASELVLSNSQLELAFDKKRGALISLSKDGQKILRGDISLNLWRGTTDNDGIRGWAGQELKVATKWRELGLDEIRQTEALLQVLDTSIHLKRQYTSSKQHLIKLDQVFRILDDKLLVENYFSFPKELADLPRVGVQMMTVAGFEDLEWFGRGPHESYWDRKAGNYIGSFSAAVSAQLHPYVVPQESGNKCDVRWLSVSSPSSTLKISSKDPKNLLEVNASHFSGKDLSSCMHTIDLKKFKRPETLICVDLHQRGLGTASCGPDTLEKYRLPSGDYRLDFYLS